MIHSFSTDGTLLPGACFRPRTCKTRRREPRFPPYAFSCPKIRFLSRKASSPELTHLLLAGRCSFDLENADWLLPFELSEPVTESTQAQSNPFESYWPAARMESVASGVPILLYHPLGHKLCLHWTSGPVTIRPGELVRAPESHSRTGRR
ncbi:hypothetical protein CERZMDRAFT_90310 [Cercospora zeae-maydis SCOH1-5]|uniref:Uncharacterized protein n=1 Tax=Cercospora zeae-maydis SCOH1-5 TaxID=717836 RepID=A0A6A6FLH1_9PEZI|nr:hypothetical protein CERZMDRAFT_90310 [Cercospora zeae-maydis SCOH1-5]